MGRRPRVQTGTTGGCLFNGCLTLCVLLLVTVAGTWIWVTTQPERDEAKARADMRAGVEESRQLLRRAAADGILEDAEITRIFPPSKSAGGVVDIRRHGDSVTVTAELLGIGPPRAFIFVHATTVEGCFAFHVPPPAREAPPVSAEQLPDETCTPAVSAPPASAP